MPKNKTWIEENFNDQFFASTQGRNDIRREKIQKQIDQAREEERERILESLPEEISCDCEKCDAMPFQDGWNTCFKEIKDIINKL